MYGYRYVKLFIIFQECFKQCEKHSMVKRTSMWMEACCATTQFMLLMVSDIRVALIRLYVQKMTYKTYLNTIRK